MAAHGPSATARRADMADESRRDRPRAPPRDAPSSPANADRNGDASRFAIRHNMLRDALVETFGIPPEGAEAIGQRVKALLGLGLRRDGQPAPGRGRGHRNELPDALEVAFALTLQRAFAPPSAAVGLILANRHALDAAWARAARGERATVTVAIDALSLVGREGMRTGRFSEDPVGSLAIVTPGAATEPGRTAAAPRISIDFARLFEVLTDNLRRAGVDRAGLREAEHRVADPARA